MRDPRSGFATGFCHHHGPVNGALLAVRALALLLCQACGGAATPSPSERPQPTPLERSAAPAPEAAEPRVVRLRYAAPPDCPDAERYSSHVRSRSANLSVQPEAEAPASDDAVDVRVEPAREVPGWLGRVTIEGPLALDREVRGARCEDVVAALALITVLRLEGADASALSSSIAGTTSSSTGPGSTAGATVPDVAPPPTSAGPSASPAADADAIGAEPSAPAEASESTATAPAPAAPELPGTEPPGVTGPATEPSVPAVEGAASDDRSASSAEEHVARNDDAAREAEPALPEPLAPDPGMPASGSTTGTVSADSGEASSARPSWRWPSVSSAAVAVRAGYASVPEHAFKGALEGELHLGEGWVSELSLAYARGKDEVAVAKLDLSLLTLDLGLCPLELGAQSPVWLRACAGVRAGALHLAIRPTQPELSEATVWRPWASVGPSLRVGVPLSDRWTLRALAELAVQLVRDNFDVELTPADDSASRRFTVYRPEALSVELGLGIGHSF